MPADALPVGRPVPVPVPGAVPYRREYRDPLGRPMSGTVTITPSTRATVAGTVVAAAAVSVDLVGGVLEVELAPGSYTLSAALRTVDGVRAGDVDTITLD